MTKKILQRKISGFKSFKGRWLTVATGCFESVRFADLGGRACLSFDCRSGGVLGRDTLRCRQAESKNWHHGFAKKKASQSGLTELNVKNKNASPSRAARSRPARRLSLNPRAAIF